MRPRLKSVGQQTIVITGGSSGVGLATANMAVQRGARVVLAARNGIALDRIAADLRSAGGQVATCVVDVAIEEDLKKIVAVAIDRFGGFDSWVNDAASATYGRMDQVSLEDHRRIFDVNYHGVLMGSLIAARHLRERPGGGAIINMGSVLSDRAMIYQGPYSATKAAVQAATDSLRMELERENAPVSVTLIKPGSLYTPYPEHARNYLADPPRLPPPLYDPQLAADAILFACENPRRQIYVGGGGYLISLAGRLAPRLTDLAMEMFGGTAQQKQGDAGDPSKRDNLHEPRADGEVRGSQDLFVRKTSVLLEVQKQPLNAPFAVAAAGLELLEAITRRGAARDKAALQSKPPQAPRHRKAIRTVNRSAEQNDKRANEKAQEEAARKRESEGGYQ